MTEIRVVIGLFRSNVIVFDQAELLGRIQSKSETGGLAAVVVYAVVPAVQQETTQRGLAVECVLRSHPEMEVGDGPGKKQTARVVPVVLGFNHLSAYVSNELSDVDLQTLARRREIREIAFLEVLGEVCFSSDGQRWRTRSHGRRRFGRIHQIHRLAEAERNVVADAAGRSIWGLVRDQLDHIQPKLARVNVKVAEGGRATRRLGRGVG